MYLVTRKIGNKVQNKNENEIDLMYGLSITNNYESRYISHKLL